MKNKYLYFPLILLWGLISQASAQTTTTIGGLSTAVSGSFTATSKMLVNISGTDYNYIPNTLAQVVLSNLTLSPGLGTSGTSITFTGVQSITLGSGLSANSTTGSITLSNSGVTSITAGNGITVNANTGAITISNIGVTSFTLGAGLSGVSGTGAITLSNAGVLTVTLGAGLSGVSGAGAITLSNSGVTTITLGTGLTGVSGAGAITLSNSGVTSFTLGIGLSGVSGAGAVTLSNNGLLSLSTPTNSIYNAQMLTGTATLVANTSAVVQFSNIGIGAAPSSAAVIYANTSKSGQIGMRIQGVTSQSSVYLDITTTAGVSVFNVDPFYGVNIRHASTTNMLSVGTAGSQIWGLNSSVAASYQQMMLGNGAAFSNTNLIASTTPCISSTAAGVLQVTDTAGSRLNLAIGSLSMGYRSVSTTGSLTTTDGIVNITTSNITVSMADATTLTGRTTVLINSSAGTSTVQGFTSTQFFNGSSNTTLSIPSGSSLRLISTGTTTNSYYTY